MGKTLTLAVLVIVSYFVVVKGISFEADKAFVDNISNNVSSSPSNYISGNSGTTNSYGSSTTQGGMSYGASTQGNTGRANKKAGG